MHFNLIVALARHGINSSMQYCDQKVIGSIPAVCEPCVGRVYMVKKFTTYIFKHNYRVCVIVDSAHKRPQASNGVGFQQQVKIQTLGIVDN